LESHLTSERNCRVASPCPEVIQHRQFSLSIETVCVADFGPGSRISLLSFCCFFYVLFVFGNQSLHRCYLLFTFSTNHLHPFIISCLIERYHSGRKGSSKETFYWIDSIGKPVEMERLPHPCEGESNLDFGKEFISLCIHS